MAGFNFRRFFEGLNLVPKSGSATSNSAGDLQVLSSNNKLSYHNGSSPSPVVTEDHVATLTNKTIGDQLTFVEIDTPGTNPEAGKLFTYAKSDNNLYTKNSDGTETLIGSGGGPSTSWIGYTITFQDVINSSITSNDSEVPLGDIRSGLFAITNSIVVPDVMFQGGSINAIHVSIGTDGDATYNVPVNVYDATASDSQSTTNLYTQNDVQLIAYFVANTFVSDLTQGSLTIFLNISTIPNPIPIT